MSARAVELRKRRLQLQLRCEAQRAELGRIAGDLQWRVRHVDRGIEIAKRLTSAPLLLALGLGVFLFLGPGSLIRWVRRTLAFVTTVRRLTRFA
jgi:hypothetical protein